MARDWPRRAVQALRDLPLNTKGLLVVSIPLLGMLAVIVAFYLVQRENQAAEAWVSHTLEVRSQIQSVHTHLEEAETSMLGYVVTRRDRWLGPFRTAQKELPGILDRLMAMLADNPVQAERARVVSWLVRERMTTLAQLPRRVPSGGGPHPALLDSKISMDAIHQQLEQLQANEDRLLGERREHARRVWARGYLVIAVGLLFAPAGAILAMLLFTTGVARRVQWLDKQAHQLAQGVALAPARQRTGKDEIGRLEESLAEAAALLSERQSQLRAAADELEARVRERTGELARSNEALGAEVSERKRAEEELAEANQRLRAVIDASPLAIIRLDLEGNVKSWNRAAEQIFGWNAEEVLNQPLPTIPNEEMQHFHELLTGAAHGEVLTGFETRRRRKDGRLIDIRLWTAPLRTASGEIRGKIALAADFTEERRLADQFTQAQKMEAIGRLAGGVAHDFNNVITVVAGYGHILLEGVKKDPALREPAEEILKAAERAAGLATQLLAFSRRQVIQPKVVDLNTLIANFQRMLGRVIGEDVELKTILAPDLGAVRADPGQIEQVLMNMAVNARDAMPGGGKLTIETANVELDDSFTRVHSGTKPGPYVMLAVSDTGHGMDAETRSHLFEPFFTTKERGKGTGLGLSTVYGIVKQHGGDLWVYSEPGHGTTFKIYLPQMGRAAVAAAGETARTPAPAGTETVLLVEDEEGVRRLVRDVLEQQGYKVLEAESGQRALSVGEEYGDRIDLLVTDVVMPNMSGRDLAEALMLLRPEIKVLFLSGYTEQMVVQHGVLDDAADFLQKPFTPDTLAHKVREVLDKKDGHAAR